MPHLYIFLGLLFIGLFASCFMGWPAAEQKSYKSMTAALLTACPADRGLLSTSRSAGGGNTSLITVPDHREIIGSQLDLG